MTVGKITVVLIFTLVLAACSPARVIDSASVLGDIAAGEGPSRLKRITPAPRRNAITYRVAQRQYAGDVYHPGNDGGAPLVLVPGVAPAGKDDRRLVAFANTLSRAGFTVLVPDIENLRALKVKSSDTEGIADAIRHLGTGRKSRIGLAAISYAAGPAILAALRNDIRCRIGFVLAIGGYHDSAAMLTYMTTGQYRERAGGPWLKGRRNDYAMWISMLSYADLISDPGDRDVLGRMARRKLRNPAAYIGDLVARLGTEGRAFHALITNDDPVRVPGLIAGLPEKVQTEIAALDLKGRDFHRLGANLILIHGRDDAVIPYSESQALAAAVPGGRASVYLVDSLAHVDLGPAGIIDTLVLWRAVYRLLEEREALRRPFPKDAPNCAAGSTDTP